MTAVELDNEGYTCVRADVHGWLVVDRYGARVLTEPMCPTYESARARAEELNADVIRRRVGR